MFYPGMQKRVVARLAAEFDKDDLDPMEIIDLSVDKIVEAVTDIGEAIPKFDAQSNAEIQMVKTVKDTMEKAIGPYMVDVIEALESVEAE